MMGKLPGFLKEIMTNLSTLIKESFQGVILQEGLSLVIAGRPNAGKSTLINQLAGRDVSIVTEVAGTTRDVMKEHILLDDIPLHIIDTAGLHDSSDIVEKEGIKRTRAALSEADCAIMMVDASSNDNAQALHQEIRDYLPVNTPIVKVLNKIDVLSEQSIKAQDLNDAVYISAKTGKNLSSLKTMIKQKVGYTPGEGKFLARRRHLDALDKAQQLLITGQEQLASHRAGELLAEDLKLTHLALCEITGEFTADDLLGEIFSSFCIGK